MILKVLKSYKMGLRSDAYHIQIKILLYHPVGGTLSQSPNSLYIRSASIQVEGNDLVLILIMLST